jgi:hypothetical protein
MSVWRRDLPAPVRYRLETASLTCSRREDLHDPYVADDMAGPSRSRDLNAIAGRHRAREWNRGRCFSGLSGSSERGRYGDAAAAEVDEGGEGLG